MNPGPTMKVMFLLSNLDNVLSEVNLILNHIFPDLYLFKVDVKNTRIMFKVQQIKLIILTTLFSY